MAARLEAFAYRCAWTPVKGIEYVGPGCCFVVYRTNSVRKVHADQLQKSGWKVTMSRGQIASAVCPTHAGLSGGPLLMEDPARWSRSK